MPPPPPSSGVPGGGKPPVKPGKAANDGVVPVPGEAAQPKAAPPPPKPRRNDVKRINWNLIPNMKLAKTLYAQKDFQDNEGIDEEVEKDLLERFSNKPPPRTEVDEEEEKKQAEAASKGPKTAGILDQKRTTNTLIMLRKFPCKSKEIAIAVKTLDPAEKWLTLDNVNALVGNAFKAEELEMAKNFAAPEEEVEELNEAEKLAYYMARVQRWQVKIKAMATMRTWKEVHDEIKTSITAVISASKEVLQSKRFRRVLARILAIGNFLNAGTTKGSARGFKLEALNRLAETKAREKDQNLLHFVLELIEKKDPDALLLADDMPSVLRAKRVAKEDVARELTTFRSGVTLTGREVTALEKERNSGNSNDAEMNMVRIKRKKKSTENIAENEVDKEKKKASKTTEEDEQGEDSDDMEEVEIDMADLAKEIVGDASAAVTELTSLQEDMTKSFHEVVVQLGEEPKNAKVEDFFGTLSAFLEAFTQSAKDNSNRKEEEARRERLAKRNAEEKERRRLRAEAAAAAAAERDKKGKESGVGEGGKEVSGADVHSSAVPKPAVKGAEMSVGTSTEIVTVDGI